MSKGMTGKQTMLGAVFMVTMLLGFVAVAYIDYEFQNNGEPVLLYTTDSNTKFVIFEYDNEPVDYYPDLRTCQRIAPNHLQYNRTPVYEGGDSWVLGLNDTTEDFNTAVIVIELPDLHHWIINELVFNVTENNDDSYKFITQFIHNTPTTEGVWDLDTAISTTVRTNWHTGGQTWFNGTDTIALNDGIGIYNDANNNNVSLLFIQFYDDGGNWDGWALHFKYEIWGVQVSGWNLNDSVFAALIASIILNVIVIVYMTDGFDMGKVTRVLKRRK